MFSAHYGWMVHCLSGEFFDAMFEEWARAGGFNHMPIRAFDMAYCGGGPI